MSEMKERCQTCAVVAQCKAAFGDYWTDKSGGGVGCAYPFPGYAGAEARRPEAQDAPRREPWEIAHTTRGRSAGIYCMNKRHGMARQGRLI